jgi:hypothetical protein
MATIPSFARRAFAAAGVSSMLLAATAARAQDALPVVEPFTRDFDADVFLAGGQAFAVDVDALRMIGAEGEEALVAAFPLSRRASVDLRVHRIVPRAAGARCVVVDRFGREIPVAQPETHFLGGEIVGVAGSSVFLAVSDAGVHGWIQLGLGEADARFMVTTGPYAARHAPAVFDMHSEAFAAIDWVPFECEYMLAPQDGDAGGDAGAGGGDDGDGTPAGAAATLLPNCRAIEVAVETDQEFLARFSGNTAAALGYVQTLVAGSDEIYRRDAGVQLRISYTRFWSTTDPWTSTTTGAQLGEFRNHWLANMSGVSRDVAHFMSARGLGGGIAYLNAVCNNLGYAVSANMSGSFPTPMVDNNPQNWDIMVFTHELGHNAGSVHTHDFCPPLDQCAPAGYFGQCQGSQVCISTGTVMSYCHQCSGGMSNFVLAFHPTCAAAINGYLSGQSCAPVVACASNPACVLSVSSAGANYPASGGSASVTVTAIAAGCAWTPVTVPSWITITNPGPASGSGSFAYTVAPNTSPSARSFTIVVGDLTHTVQQTNFLDCNGNGTNDAAEIAGNPALDCNGDGVLNSCELAAGAEDCDGNGVPDGCQLVTAVRAFGAGAPGTAGDPNYGQSTVPDGLGVVKALGAGGWHSVAVRADGTLAAWGRNDFGQSNVPAGLVGIVAVAGGQSHTLALAANGAVSAWGRNESGQSTVPLTLGSAIAIAAGTSHSVALKADGTVTCWGSNALGQSTPPAGLANAVAISAGFVNTLALRADGSVLGWGQNGYGQNTPPAGLAGVTGIASGAAHSVALRSNGSIALWGNNTYGQLDAPADLGPVSRVFAGNSLSVALQADGRARAWGQNTHGEANLPPTLEGIASIAVGGFHTMVLTSSTALPDLNGNGTPDACEPGRPADLNGDGTVSAADLAILLGNWGAATGAGDLNGDGQRDAADLAILLSDWG